MCYPSNLPKQKDCRIDIVISNNNTFRLLVDCTDNSVIYVATCSAKTLTAAYSELKFDLKNNLRISSYVNGLTNLSFKKIENVMYADF